MSQNMKVGLNINTEVKGLQNLAGMTRELKNAGKDTKVFEQRLEQLDQAWEDLAPKKRGQQTRKLREALQQALDAKTPQQYAQAVRQATGDLDNLNKKANKSENLFGRFKKGVVGVGTALGGAFAGAKVIGFFKNAVTGSANLQEQLSKVQAVSGATAGEIAKIEQVASELGASTRYTATEAAQGFETLARSGLNAQQSIEVIPQVLALAQGNSISLADAAGYVTKTIAGMNLEMSDSGRVADVLSKAAVSANTSVEGLGQALSYAAPSAAAVGVSLEETVAIIGKFADAGIDASRGGTALNSILSQFGNNSSKFKKELSKIGITTNNFGDALRQLATSGKSGTDAINAVGQEAGPALKALLAQGIPALDGLIDKLENSEGAAKKAAETMDDNLPGALRGLSSAWSVVRNAIGKPLLQPIREQVEKLATSLRDAVADGTVEEWAKSFADGFSVAVKTVSALVSGFVKLLPIITTVTTAFIALKAVNLTKSFLSANSALVGSLTPSMTQAGTTATVTAGKVGKLGSVLKTISGVFKATIIVEGLKSYYNWYQALRDRQAVEISLAKIEAENIALFKRKIAIGQQMVKENEAYKDTLHLTATELEQLNEVEKKAYQEKLEKQREYYQGQVKILVHQQALGEQVTVDEANIRQALLDTNQALTALDDTFKQTADTTQNTVAPSVNKLIEKFDELESKQHDVGASLQDIYKDVDFTNPKAVADLLELLQKLVDQGELTKEQMQDSLAKVLDTLPADKLQKFMGAVRYTSEEVHKGIEVSTQALQASVEAIAKKLNLDIEKYRSGMSSATKQGIDDFRRLVRSGTKDARLLGDAFEEAAKRVSTPAGLQALKKVQQEAVKLGIAGAKSMGETVEKTSQRLTDATIQQQQQVEQHTQGLVDTAIEGLDNTSTSAQGVVDVMKTGNVSLEQQAGLLGAMNDASEEAGRKGREAVTVVGKVGETADKSTKSLRSMGSAASVVGVFLNAAKSRLTALSAAAYDTFKNALNIGSATKEAGTLNAKLERTQKKMDELRRASIHNTGGVSSFLNKIAQTATRIEGEYYKQKIAAEKLSKSLKDGVVPATALMSKNASRARAQFNLLDKQGLDNLVSEIEQAQEKLKAFNQEAKDTRSALKSELNDLEGNYEAVAKARAKQREQEIKDKLDEAKKNRNTEAIANLQKSLELLKRINANNIAQAKQRQIDERKQKQEDNTIRNEPPPKTQVNINIGGESISAEVDSEETARRLARALAQARQVAQ